MSLKSKDSKIQKQKKMLNQRKLVTVTYNLRNLLLCHVYIQYIDFFVWFLPFGKKIFSS